MEGGESILYYEPGVGDLFSAKRIISERGEGEQKHREE